MTRQVTDQLYIELDYFTPEEYYVYTAEAEVALSSSASVSCTISNIKGADLVAFSDAALTTEATVTRGFDATITAQATIDQFVGDLYALRSASLSSEFAQTSTANRLREPQIALDSAFTFDATVSINGAVVGHGDWSSAFTLDITPNLFKDMGANLYADAVCDPDGVQRIRDVDSTQAVEFTQTLVYTKIVQGACAVDALFSPSMTVEAVRNAFAVLDSTAALTTVVNANRSAQVALSSIINQSLQGDRIRDYAVDASSQFALTANYVNTVPVQATLSSASTLTSTALRVKQLQATLSGAFSPTITAVLTKSGQIALTSQFTQTATVSRLRNCPASISAVASITANVTTLAGSQFFVDALEISTNIDPLQTIYDGGFESITDSFGNVYTVGVKANSTVGSFVSNDLILSKNDARGKLQWQRKISGNFLSAQSTTNISCNLAISGNFLYISYGTYYGTTITQSFSFQRFNLNTEVIQTLPTTQSVIHDIKDYNGSIYTLSTRFSGTSGGEIGLPIITKYNANGTIAWAKSAKFSGSTQQQTMPFSSLEVNASGVYCAIRSPSLAATFGGIYKFDLDGNYQFNWNSTTRYDNVKIDSSGNIYAAGRYGVSPGTTPRHILIKYNSTFTVQWVMTDITTFDGYYEFEINGDQDLVGYTDTGKFITVSKDGAIIKSKSLQIFNSSNTLYTTILPRGINIQNGWINFGAIWNRNSQRQYVSFQVQDDLSQDNFSVPVISSFADANNTTLRWVDNTPVTTGTRTIDGSISYTSVIADATTSGSVSTGSYTTTTYTDIPLLVAKQFNATLATQFTVTANNRRNRSTPAALSATLTQTTNAVKTVRITRTLSAQATLVPNGGYIRGITATLQSNATVTASLGLTKRYQAALNTQAVVNSSVRKFVGNGASLFPVITTTINNSRIRSFSSTITAMASELAVVVKTGRGIIQLDSTATQTTNAVKTARGHVDTFAVATQTSEVVKTVRVSSSVEARATFTVDAKRLPQTPVSMQSAFTQTTATNNSKITRITASATTQATQTTTPVKTVRTQPNLTAQTSLTFGNQVTRLRLAQSQQNAQATLLAPAVKTVRTGAELTAFDTVLAIGTKIAFDRELQLLIPSESGSLIVPEENTLLYVPIETRVNMVRKIAI